MQYTTLGERLKDLREAQGITQSKVAEYCGAKSAAVVSAWEKDKNKPDIETILRLCTLFEVSPNYLLGYVAEGNEITLSQRENIVIETFRMLDDRGCEEIMNHLASLKKYIECFSDNNSSRKCCAVGSNEHKVQNEVQLGRFLDYHDSSYHMMKTKSHDLKILQKNAQKSEEDVTKFLWDLGYGNTICLRNVIDILAGRRVPDEIMYKHIYAFLTGRVQYSFN